MQVHRPCLGALSPLTRSNLFSRLLLNNPSDPSSDGYAGKAPTRARRITAYQCRGCFQLHGDEDEAASCCEPDEVDGWECQLCGRIRRHEEDAVACCEGKKAAKEKAAIAAPARAEPRRIECPVCGASFGQNFQEPDGSWLDAAFCCLSRDLAPAKLHEIEQMVRLRGMEWVEAIEAATGSAAKGGLHG